MTIVTKNALSASLLGLLTLAGSAGAQPSSCQAQLDAVAADWSAAGLPSLSAAQLGGMQGKSGMIRLKSGVATSAANVQYMTIQLHQAADACRSGDGETAKEKVALVRVRLDSMVR